MAHGLEIIENELKDQKALVADPRANRMIGVIVELDIGELEQLKQVMQSFIPGLLVRLGGRREFNSYNVPAIPN